jgi:hypothetical protein
MAGFTLIEDTVLGSAAASITFSDLGDWTKFRLTLYAIGDGSAKVVSARLNGDTGTNYARQQLGANSTTVAGERVTGDTDFNINSVATLGANQMMLCTLEISKPLTTTPARGTASVAYNSTVVLEEFAYEWNNTADLISSITILSSSGNFAAGSRAVLEGA